MFSGGITSSWEEATTPEPTFSFASDGEVSAESSPASGFSVPGVSSSEGVEVVRSWVKENGSSFHLFRLTDYVTNIVLHVNPCPASPVSSRKSGTPYPISYTVNCNRFSSGHRNFLAAITAGGEPKSYKEVVVDPKWRKAMQCEIRALEDNGTWSMVPFPPSKTLLGTQWVFKIKYNSDGNIERYKARLVLFGNHQVEGIDYTNTFSQVAKMVTVRIFLAVAVAKR
ncbi:transmembrane signal receptor [Lithospermum erythrorhizon]|uniref:Transmembrane signal receptor n=1 Tax=Lithospermum erythrorhizon TaxID=34254 RepID=A0AAV3RP14_LITER